MVSYHPDLAAAAPALAYGSRSTATAGKTSARSSHRGRGAITSSASDAFLLFAIFQLAPCLHPGLQ